MDVNQIVNKVNKGINNPKLAYIELGRRMNRFYHTRAYQRQYNPYGIDIFDEDWDNLIILDACRYDSLAEKDIDAIRGFRISRGSSSREFINANFIGRNLNDVVYVTANAWYSQLQTERTSIHKFVNLQAKDIADPEVGMELPESVSEAARKYHDRYPNKRLVVHFMQPHHPYVTERGRRLVPPKKGMTQAILSSDCSKQTIRELYHENLDLVLEEVQDLLEEIQGKTVITSDHGELLGERSFPVPYREYGHPRGTYVNSLVKVPWFERTTGERKSIKAEEPEHDTDTSSKAVEDRLHNLGYKI